MVLAPTPQLWEVPADAIEALNRQLRKAVKTKGHFPSEDAARKLLYLAIQNAVPAWTMTPELDDRAAATSETAYLPNQPVRRTPSPELTRGAAAPGSSWSDWVRGRGTFRGRPGH